LMLAKPNLGKNLIFKTLKKPELYHRWVKRKPHTKNPHWPDIKMSMTKGLIVFLAKSRHGLNSLKTLLHLNICYDTLHTHIAQIFSLGFWLVHYLTSLNWKPGCFNSFIQTIINSFIHSFITHCV
jgi:hypothetical protein